MGRPGFSLFILAAAAMVAPASADVLSDASISGTYYFRYLGALPTDTADIPIGFQGTMTFNGAGSYTVTGQGAIGLASGLRPLTSGSYHVAGSGLFYMTNPVDNTGETFLFGGLGSGPIVASSTDTGFVDILVAIPVSTAASNATLSGNYQVASLEFLNGDFAQSRNTFFSMTADGAGNLGNVTIKGTAMNLANAATTQTSAGATYTVGANGMGTLNLPAPGGITPANTLLAGNKVLYVSSDGNLFIAGTASGYDMVIGIKAFSGNSPATSFSGLYYTSLLENYAVGSTVDGLYGGQGVSNELGNGSELAHQRLNYYGLLSYDYTYAGSFNLAADGTASYSDSLYALGAGGNFMIGSGNGPNYQLTIYAKIQPVSGSGVFLNPQAIQNKANNVPFSAQVAPGMYLDAYGSGLSNGTIQASTVPFPTTLGGVQVTVNGTPAPIYYVSPTLVSFINPFTSPQSGGLLQIKVINNGTDSNVAELWPGMSSPSIFTIPPGGIGNGAIQHADYSLVTPDSPARPGETVIVYMGGLGRVSGNTAAGDLAPANPLAVVANPIAIYIGGLECQTSDAVLTPGSVNLYQINVRLPDNVPAGTQAIEVATVDGDNYQATIPVVR